MLAGYEDVNVNCANVYGDTPIFVAAEHGHEGSVRLLYELGADLNLRDVHGFHPVYIAACRGHVGMVRLLVTELGCDPEVLTNNGDTAVLIAARGSHHSVVQALVGELGAQPDIANRDGITPFIAAAYAGDEVTCRTLLSYGASVTSRHLPCISSLQHLGHHSVVRLINVVHNMQRLARSGHVQLIKEKVVESSAGYLPPPVQWVQLLPRPAVQELLFWAQGTLQDSSLCFMALFGPVGADDTNSFRSMVGHDGLSHVVKLIASFVVHDEAMVRENIRELARGLKIESARRFGTHILSCCW
jgi:ankyrin repeat protein